MRILIVQDELKVADALRKGLEDEQYDVSIVRTGKDALSHINAEQFQAILLDVKLPDQSRLQFLRNLRKWGVDTPVLLLAASGKLKDRVSGPVLFCTVWFLSN
jgi:DNA-binding response OmpR family regulator